MELPTVDRALLASRHPSSSSLCLTSFDSRDLHPTRELFCILPYLLLLDLYDKRYMDYVMFIILWWLCIVLYVGIYVCIPCFALHSDPFCCTLCLAYIRGGFSWPTYIRRSDVSVSVESGRYRLVSELRLLPLYYKQVANSSNLRMPTSMYKVV